MTKNKKALGFLAFFIGMFCMAITLSLSHLGIATGWALHIGSASLSLDFFRGFFGGVEIVLLVGAVCLLMMDARDQRKDGAVSS